MEEPVAYISTWRIKEGRFEAYRRFYAELVKIVDENEPDVIAYLAFANEDGTEVTNIHIFPHTAAVETHMAVLAEKMGLLSDDLTAVFQYLEPSHVTVFGAPGDRAEAMDRGLIDGGVPFTFKRRYLGGFTRNAPSAG
jgi:hypothetical protein